MKPRLIELIEDKQEEALETDSRTDAEIARDIADGLEAILGGEE